MGPWRHFRSLIIFTWIAALAGACVTPASQPAGGKYYLAADMTYLRDAASYAGNVAGQLYKGDQVERLEVGGSGWWRVRSGRTGLYGWVAAELFSPNPVPVPIFLVTHTINLRECPKEFCPSLQMLSRGDQVQKVEANDQGWWRVLVARSHNLGWLPAQAVAETLEEPQARTPNLQYYFVAVRRLPLRREPLVKAEAVTLLQFNDQVEKLDQHPSGWLKIRQPASGAVGWVQERYLWNTPLKFPRFEKPRKKRPQPEKPSETEPQPEPEIM